MPETAATDLRAFLARLQERKATQQQLTRVGKHLIDGALRVRRGGDGIYEVVPRPVTKPAEAVGAWLDSLEESAVIGEVPRLHETREAVAAAAEELDHAAKEVPSASRLRTALYADALGALGPAPEKRSSSAVLPWTIAGVLAGVLLGVVLVRRPFRLPAARRRHG